MARAVKKRGSQASSRKEWMNCICMMVCFSASVMTQSLTWTQLHIPPAAAVTNIIGLPEVSLMLETKSGTGGGTQAFSSRGAYSGWTDLQTEVLGFHIYAAVSDADGNMSVGTDSAGVLRSTDGGTSWQSVQDGLLSNTVTSLHAESSGHLFAGTPDAGLFRTSSPTTHLREDRPPETVPEAMMCFPNPFNSSTTIHISVGAPGRVQLIVYDILGRPVDLLLDEFMSAGVMFRTWQPDGHPSGTYVVRLRHADHSSTTKVLYLR